jgi:hypothetical protein
MYSYSHGKGLYPGISAATLMFTKTLCILMISEFTMGIIETRHYLRCAIDLFRTRGFVGEGSPLLCFLFARIWLALPPCGLSRLVAV